MRNLKAMQVAGGKIRFAIAVSLGGLCLALLSTGCVGPFGTLRTTSNDYTTQCSPTQPSDLPNLMAWDPNARQRLSSLRAQGMVAVRYSSQGCQAELKLLPGCIVSRYPYGYRPYASRETKTNKSTAQLFAELPLGAANFSSKVQGSNGIRTDVQLVGMFAVPADTRVEESDLRGPDCAEATHVVREISVGGFSMVAGDEQRLEASAGFFGIGAGGAQFQSVEVVFSEGTAEACQAAVTSMKNIPTCEVPLRVNLMPIPGRQASGGYQLQTVAGSRGPNLARITVPGYADYGMDETEVTVDQFQACVYAGACRVEMPYDAQHEMRRFCNFNQPGRQPHPMNCVSWQQADTFCRWAGKTLPNEQAWQHASSGADGRPYPWGGQPPTGQLCWNRSVGSDQRNWLGTCAVASYPAGRGPFGLFDMAGNVWEWMATVDGQNRVIRGGSWIGGITTELMPSNRTVITPDRQFPPPSVGFRCMK